MGMASTSLSFSSSLFPSPLPHDKNNTTTTLTTKHRANNPNSSFIRCAFAASPEATEKNRHWKQGEYPAISGTSKKPPINSVKKKLDRKNKTKAWVNTVTEALSDHILKSQWLEALQVFEMLREQSFYQPKEGTYMKLLVLLGKSGQPHRAHQIFDEMIEEGCEPTSELYTALLAAYCQNNLIDEAFSILNQMKTLPRCQPDVFTYSTLIKPCVDALWFELVETLYEEMTERLITPNTVTQNIVLNGYGKAGNFDQMEKLLSGMLESKACKPDVWTMNTILSVFGNKGQIDMMERWYEKFRNFGIEPETSTFNILIGAYGKKRMYDKMWKSKGKPDVWTMNTILSVFGDKGQVDMMERWYDKFPNFGIEPETRTFNILIGAYGKKRMYDKMSSVMEYMRKLKIPWTTSTYNNVIEAFADVGDVKHMEYTFDQMHAESMKANTKTFCYLVNGYANAGLFHKVISSVQLAAKFEIPETTSFYNAVISACARAEDLMEMDRVFKRMKDKQCPPDSRTYSIMVEAYRKESMNDKVYDLEQEKQEIFAKDSAI